MSTAPEQEEGTDVSEEIRELEGQEGGDPEVATRKPEAVVDEPEAAIHELSRYERVKLARHQQRPFTLDYIDYLFSDFVELHGDRSFRDDPAIVAGWADFRGRSLMVIGHQKGRDMKENVRRNFGSAHPEGYRKAERLMRMAEKFGKPVVTFVDTQGAYPGIGAEERGQAEAIARNLFVMSGLRTPIVSCVIGEGGSGGALGIAVADRVLMMENAIYSVISPEGCAAILWRSRDEAERAAEALKLTASDLIGFGIVDELIPEPAGGAHVSPESAMEKLGEALARVLDELCPMDSEELVRARHEKYYAMGRWEEVQE